MAAIIFGSPSGGDHRPVGTFLAQGSIDPPFTGFGQVTMKAWLSWNGQTTEGAVAKLPLGADGSWKFNMVATPTMAGHDVWFSVKMFPPDNSQPSCSSIQIHIDAFLAPTKGE